MTFFFEDAFFSIGCWDSMVVILSAGLGQIEDSRAAKLVKFSKKHLKVGNASRKRQNGEAALYALSLEGLHAVREFRFIYDNNINKSPIFYI